MLTKHRSAVEKLGIYISMNSHVYTHHSRISNFLTSDRYVVTLYTHLFSLKISVIHWTRRLFILMFRETSWCINLHRSVSLRMRANSGSLSGRESQRVSNREQKARSRRRTEAGKWKSKPYPRGQRRPPRRLERGPRPAHAPDPVSAPPGKGGYCAGTRLGERKRKACRVQSTPQ